MIYIVLLLMIGYNFLYKFEEKNCYLYMKVVLKYLVILILFLWCFLNYINVYKFMWLECFVYIKLFIIIC